MCRFFLAVKNIIHFQSDILMICNDVKPLPPDQIDNILEIRKKKEDEIEAIRQREEAQTKAFHQMEQDILEQYMENSTSGEPAPKILRLDPQSSSS